MTKVFETETDIQVFDTEKYLHLTGIIFSTTCFISKIRLLILHRKIRKYDQKLLMQLAVARLIHSALFYLMIYYREKLFYVIGLSGLPMMTEIALRWWMFIYTKNLYEKMVKVFVSEKWSFLQLSLVIWITSPLLTALFHGLICLLWEFDALGFHFRPVSITLTVFKAIPLCVNFVLFIIVFYTIVKTKMTARNCDRITNVNFNIKFTIVIKICVISFILVSLTSVQLFVVDVLIIFLVFGNGGPTIHLALRYVFAISSFQGIEILIIFLILMKHTK